MSEPTIAQRLQQEVIEPMKARYVGRDEVIDLIGLALVAGEHLFLYGPPGTAKSALVREFSSLVQGRYFEYMLTRFSEPNEIFGPIDIGKLREGVVATVTSSMGALTSPVRISGPLMSIMIATSRPTLVETARMRRMTSRVQSCLAWAMLSRMTSTPPFMSLVRAFSDSVAGPRVTTILVRR